MKPGDLTIIGGSLAFSLKAMREKWEDTRQQWDDAVSQNFQEKHLEPVEPEVRDALKAMDRLAQIFARAYEECS